MDCANPTEQIPYSSKYLRFTNFVIQLLFWNRQISVITISVIVWPRAWKVCLLDFHDLLVMEITKFIHHGYLELYTVPFMYLYVIIIILTNISGSANNTSCFAKCFHVTSLQYFQYSKRCSRNECRITHTISSCNYNHNNTVYWILKQFYFCKQRKVYITRYDNILPNDNTIVIIIICVLAKLHNCYSNKYTIKWV